MLLTHILHDRYKTEEALMNQSIRSKEQEVSTAKQNEYIAHRQTEENLRRGIDEIVHPADNVDIPAVEAEIARLKVSYRPFGIQWNCCLTAMQLDSLKIIKMARCQCSRPQHAYQKRHGGVGLQVDGQTQLPALTR